MTFSFQLNPENVIKTMSDQTANGVKTWNNQQKINNSETIGLVFKSQQIDIDTIPTTRLYKYIDFIDKNNQRLGVFGVRKHTNGTNATYLQLKNSASLSLQEYPDNTIGVTFPANSNNGTGVTTVSHNNTINGYYKLGNGLIIQWGQNDFGADTTTITLPTPFTSSNYAITCVSINEPSTFAVGGIIEGKTTTNFTCHGWNRTSRAAVNMSWIAIGY